MRRKRKNKNPSSHEWLPIDSRLVPSIFSFGHVKGAARYFLTIEMILSVLVVLGTGIVVCLRSL